MKLEEAIKRSPTCHGKLIKRVIFPNGDELVSDVNGDLYFRNDGNLPIAIVEGKIVDGQYTETARHNPDHAESIIWLNEQING